MSIKAKFKCDSVTHFTGAREINLTPVVSNSEENKTWSQHTPSGLLKMHVTNPAAFEQFETGKEYVLTIEEA